MHTIDLLIILALYVFFLPANTSINVIFRRTFDLLKFLIGVAMLLQTLPVFTLHILYIESTYDGAEVCKLIGISFIEFVRTAMRYKKRWLI